MAPNYTHAPALQQPPARAARAAVSRDETRYLERIDHAPVAGDIELF